MTLSEAKKIAEDIHRYVKEKSKEPSGNQNCLLCTWCAEARFRGYRVLPRPVYSPRDSLFDKIDKGLSIVEGAKKESIHNKDDVIKKCTSSVQDERYYCHVNWNGSTGGHEFLLLVIDDKVYVMDAQAGFVSDIDSEKGSKYFNDINWKNSFIARIDDKELNKTLLFRENNENKTIEWDKDKDIPYMKKHGMISNSDQKNDNKQSSSKYVYRIEIKNTNNGIYEALKQAMIKNGKSDEWKKFLNNPDVKKLPEPPEYKDGYESWFTEKGKTEIWDKIKDIFYKYFNESDLHFRRQSIDKLKEYKIVYSDEYQYVIDKNQSIQEQYITAKPFSTDIWDQDKSEEYDWLNPKLDNKVLCEFDCDVYKSICGIPMSVFRNCKTLGDFNISKYLPESIELKYTDARALYWIINDIQIVCSHVVRTIQSFENLSHDMKKRCEGKVKFDHKTLIKEMDDIYGLAQNISEYSIIKLKDYKRPLTDSEKTELEDIGDVVHVFRSFVWDWVHKHFPTMVERSKYPEPIQEQFIEESYQESFMDEYETPLSKIKKFFNSMKDFEYGFYSDGKKYTGDILDEPHTFDKHYHLMSSEEINKHKVCVCWDACRYEAEWFKNNLPDVEIKTYYCEYENKVGNTHTWLMFKLDDKWYVFEYTWYAKRGVKEIYSSESLSNEYIDAIPKHEHSPSKLKNAKYVLIEYDPLKDKPGLSCIEFMDTKWTKGKLLKTNCTNEQELIDKFGFKDNESKMTFKINPVQESYNTTVKERFLMRGDLYSRIIQEDENSTPETPIENMEPVEDNNPGYIDTTELGIDDKDDDKEIEIATNAVNTANEPTDLNEPTGEEPDESASDDATPTNIDSDTDSGEETIDIDIPSKSIDTAADAVPPTPTNPAPTEPFNGENPYPVDSNPMVQTPTQPAANIGIDISLSGFGTDNSPVQNQYNPKEIERLNELIASENSAIGEYFQGSKMTNIDILRRLYSDIGDEERFHVEQLLFAKSQITGEKYEPRDPDIKKEYEELLQLGMDEETAMNTAVDKVGLMANRPFAFSAQPSTMESLIEEIEDIQKQMYQEQLLYHLLQEFEASGIEPSDEFSMMLENFVNAFETGSEMVMEMDGQAPSEPAVEKPASDNSGQTQASNNQSTTSAPSTPAQPQAQPEQKESFLTRALKKMIEILQGFLGKMGQNAQQAAEQNTKTAVKNAEYLQNNDISNSITNVSLYFYDDTQNKFQYSDLCEQFGMLIGGSLGQINAVRKNDDIKSAAGKFNATLNKLANDRIQNGINKIQNNTDTGSVITKIINNLNNNKAASIQWTPEVQNAFIRDILGVENGNIALESAYQTISNLSKCLEAYITLCNEVTEAITKINQNGGGKFNNITQQIKSTIDCINTTLQNQLAADLNTLANINNTITKASGANNPTPTPTQPNPTTPPTDEASNNGSEENITANDFNDKLKDIAVNALMQLGMSQDEAESDTIKALSEVGARVDEEYIDIDIDISYDLIQEQNTFDEALVNTRINKILQNKNLSQAGKQKSILSLIKQLAQPTNSEPQTPEASPAVQPAPTPTTAQQTPTTPAPTPVESAPATSASTIDLSKAPTLKSSDSIPTDANNNPLNIDIANKADANNKLFQNFVQLRDELVNELKNSTNINDALDKIQKNIRSKYNIGSNSIDVGEGYTIIDDDGNVVMEGLLDGLRNVTRSVSDAAFNLYNKSQVKNGEKTQAQADSANNARFAGRLDSVEFGKADPKGSDITMQHFIDGPLSDNSIYKYYQDRCGFIPQATDIATLYKTYYNTIVIPFINDMIIKPLKDQIDKGMTVRSDMANADAFSELTNQAKELLGKKKNIENTLKRLNINSAEPTLLQYNNEFYQAYNQFKNLMDSTETQSGTGNGADNYNKLVELIKQMDTAGQNYLNKAKELSGSQKAEFDSAVKAENDAKLAFDNKVDTESAPAIEQYKGAIDAVKTVLNDNKISFSNKLNILNEMRQNPALPTIDTANQAINSVPMANNPNTYADVNNKAHDATHARMKSWGMEEYTVVDDSGNVVMEGIFDKIKTGVTALKDKFTGAIDSKIDDMVTKDIVGDDINSLIANKNIFNVNSIYDDLADKIESTSIPNSEAIVKDIVRKGLENDGEYNTAIKDQFNVLIDKIIETMNKQTIGRIKEQADSMKSAIDSFYNYIAMKTETSDQIMSETEIHQKADTVYDNINNIINAKDPNASDQAIDYLKQLATYGNQLKNSAVQLNNRINSTTAVI